jgi:addiction module HigA family antidote
MHNPPHPGEFIIQVYLDPNNLSGREQAGKLGVAASTLNRILTGSTSRISPEMALRLSKALGRSELAEAFPNAKAVNEALRGLLDVAATTARLTRRSGRAKHKQQRAG